ncbi:Hypothetical protein D9617_1g087740 [Elsinoe fawcettii]|nr:Hypothetical protein D9617_1g087740 [Elsinoe fawcettii]
MPYQMRNDMQSSPEVSRQDSVIDTFEPHYSLDDTYKTSLFQVVVTLEDEATPDLSPCDTSSARKSPDDPLYQARVLHNVAEQNSWLEKVHEDLFSSTISLGAFVRNSDGTYTSTATDFSALCATSVLGPAAALTFSSQEVTQLLQHTYPDQGEVRISDASSMAVVESIEDIARQDLVFRPGITQALCRSEHIILIWGMSIHEIITEAQGLQTWLRCTL